MKLPLLLLIGLLVGCAQLARAQNFTITTADLAIRRKQAIDSTRKMLADSLVAAAKRQAEIGAKVREAVEAALKKEGDKDHAEALVGTITLVPGNHYPIYDETDASGKKKAAPNRALVPGEYFVLREMNFHLENGRLLRVYANGERWRDSVYKVLQPDPAMVAAWRVAEAEARAAEQKYREAQAGQTAVAAKGLWKQKRDEAERRSADTTSKYLPATADDGPRIVTRHKYRMLEVLRLTNVKNSIDLGTSAMDDNVDYLSADRYPTSPRRAVRFFDLVSVVYASGRRMITDNGNWTLKPDSLTFHRLTAGADGLASLLEVALYTDLLSTLNNEDNGLVSTEIASWLPLHQRPFRHNGSLFWGTAVRPYVAVSRLDSKFDTLRVNSLNYIDRPNLLQRSYLRFGLNLNLLTLDTRGHVTAQLNTSWTRTITRVAGAGADTARYRNTYQNLYGLELLATVRRQHNFGADLYFTAYLHNAESRQPIANTGAEWALRPGALFYYYPFGSPTNKLFFRVSNFVFPNSRQRDFVQLQVGYSIGLGSLMGATSGRSDVAAPASVSGAHLPGE
jgi:hypothetical protein